MSLLLNRPKRSNPVLIEEVTFTSLVNELLMMELVPSIVLLLYVTELADPGGAYVTVSTTYFGSTKPLSGVGVGVGAGVGVGVGSGGKVQGEVSCPVSDDDNGTWAGIWQTWAESRCVENKLSSINSKTFFTRMSLPLQ